MIRATVSDFTSALGHVGVSAFTRNQEEQEKIVKDCSDRRKIQGAQSGIGGPVDFTLEETIYDGPETRIRRALHAPSGARLVVKLPVSDSPSLRTMGRLVHEHQILNKLGSVPGVVRAHSLTQQAGYPALYLEDLGLRSLDRLLAEQGRLSLKAALGLAAALCRVLAGVHAAGVVHKDVKPQNILVDKDCTQVVLIDFGIASELALEATEASLPEALEGTLAYISPEQTGRTARGIDARTDLYSVGVLLFEMLTGQLPFTDKDALALVYAHLAKAPPALESLRPGVAPVVSRLLERCLEKAPEQRYQTAAGLAADLERCLRLMQDDGTIEHFALGQKDFSPKLLIPQSLVGREAESQTVAEAFERVAHGAVEVLLLGGASGVGKTALVRSVYREIAQMGHGLLLSGKHDQLGRTAPYAALAQAFSGLLSRLAASPKDVFDAWKGRIGQSLGPLARVIADLVPELEWLMGPMPAVPVVPAEMAHNRLKLSWRNFLQTVTAASPPLVLFLDDLQWADPASIELLKTLLTDGDCKNLLVIAAFRDNEVDSSHPLWTLVDAIEKAGVHTSRLTLGPLNEASVQTWLATTLSAERAQVQPLSEALYQKTQGNPFFLGQLLLELHRQKRVRRNLDDGTWQWDQDAVERASATDNVVELMRNKVVELPQHTQALLGQAACAGHSFTLGELAVVSGQPTSQVVEELRPALLAGLVSPLDGQYREAQALALVQQRQELDAGYRFLHDRVQQACYERIAPERRARTHLLIGRRLQKSFEQQGGSHQKLLELVRHLNLGAEALSSDAERKELARLNLQAARAAKVNGSYRLQATLVDQAQALLGELAWHEEPALSVELALERIEADYLLREFDSVYRRAQEFLALPLPALPRLAVQELRMRTYFTSGKYEEGQQLGLSLLADQGLHFPDTDEACLGLAVQGIMACDAWLNEHPNGFDVMAAEPSIEILLMDAIVVFLLACLGTSNRIPLSVATLVRWTQQVIERQTITPVAPYGLVNLAQARAAFFADYRGDVRWAKVGAQTAERLGSPFFPECVSMRGFFGIYEMPVEQTREFHQAALRNARASGSYTGTSWATWSELIYVDLWGGRPLDQTAAKELEQRPLMAALGDMLGQHSLALAAKYMAFLRAAPSTWSPSDPDWLSGGSRSSFAAGDLAYMEAARILEAHLFLAFGEYAQARDRAEEAELFRVNVMGTPFVTEISLWRGLAAAKCCVPALSQEERAPLLATLDHAIERFRYFAEGCAENFLHKLRLLQAEHARVHGKTDEAMANYEEAITLARKERFLPIEGLAAQFYAEFHLSAGRERSAAHYLHEARDAYTRWNANTLVNFLEQKYPALLLNNTSVALPSSRSRTVTNTTSTTGSVAIDVNTTVRAAQALTSELNPQRVVGALMQLVQENAGAQSAALLLSDGDQLSVSALLSGSKVLVGLAEPLADSHPVARSVVQYVQHSRESLVLSDAPSDSRFAQDSHLRAASIHSVLAVPLIHQGRLGGILYLEHEAANAFPAARVHLLGVLAAQSAISLENARLYADLQAANTGLEAKVAERTAALDKALKELWSEMDLAKKIQTVLLPSDPQVPGYELAAVMNPADQVGGDYYDVFRFGNQDWVIIGDVSGHGVPAGLCMMMIQSMMRAVALTLERSQGPLTPRRLLGLVNEAVENNLKLIGLNKYMTVTAFCIEGGNVKYAGQHQDLLVYRASSQQVERIETQGIWIGITEGDITDFLQDDELQLAPGDLLLLYTDGCTESRVGGHLLGTEGLSDRFASLAKTTQSSAAIIEGILQSLKGAVIHDDVTLMALHRLSVATEVV